MKDQRSIYLVLTLLPYPVNLSRQRRLFIMDKLKIEDPITLIMQLYPYRDQDPVHRCPKTLFQT